MVVAPAVHMAAAVVHNMAVAVVHTTVADQHTAAPVGVVVPVLLHYHSSLHGLLYDPVMDNKLRLLFVINFICLIRFIRLAKINMSTE